MIEIIKQNLEVAEYINKNLSTAKNKIAEKFREDLIKELRQEEFNEFDIIRGKEIHDDFAQIWIKPKLYKSSLYFGIESFNGKNNNDGK